MGVRANRRTNLATSKGEPGLTANRPSSRCIIGPRRSGKESGPAGLGPFPPLQMSYAQCRVEPLTCNVKGDPEAMIKVLIADDHKMFRQGLRMLFEMEPDIKIVGEARDGLEVQEMATA